jgi:hypothetical protein
MADSTPSQVPQAAEPELLMLAEVYPACFDWRKPRPLKVGIHHDLFAAGYTVKQVRRALGPYCQAQRYRRSIIAGETRVGLAGEPAGVVTEEEAQQAKRKRRPPKPPAPVMSDTPIPKENLVPGRLELTVKFSELPQPVVVQGGMKIGIQTEGAVVTATIRPKVWRKLEEAAKTYPLWVAALTGKLGALRSGMIELSEPKLQVFEKKPKPAAG